MAQQPPIAESLHNDINTFFHRFYAMTQDGIVTEDEQEETLDTLDALNTEAEYVAESQALGIAIARRGANSWMAVELAGRQRRKNRAA